jgi:Base plate wedge protein 53
MDLMAFNTTTYSSASAYYSTPSFGNGQFLDLRIDRSIPKLQSDILFTIPPQYEYRPDLLAYDLYGNPTLWWIFAQRNPNTLIDPLWDFTANTQIYLPTKTTLQNALGI